MNGEGVEADFVEAYALLEIAKSTIDLAREGQEILIEMMTFDDITRGLDLADEIRIALDHRKNAEQGDAKAQLALGISYAEGRGILKDRAHAEKWLRKAAEQGDAEAQYQLGNVLSEGDARAKHEAASWWILAAEQGLAAAQFNLASCYGDGQGVEKDNVKEAYWYRRASEQGHLEARFNLGIQYLNGDGVPKDEIEAYAYWKLSMLTFIDQAHYQRTGEMIADQNNRLLQLEKRLSPEDRERGDERARLLRKEIDEKQAGK